MNADTRNIVLAVLLSAIVLLGWNLLSARYFPTANPPATKVVDGKQVALPKPEAPPAGPAKLRDLAIVRGESPRVAIATPRLAGSINLRGARIDDLTLTTYRETIAKDSPPIRLLAPEGVKDAYYAGFGWTGAPGAALPTADTLWTASGATLAPGRPIALSWDNGAGQLFRIDLAVDADYMFTVRQSVANRGTAPVRVAPYQYVNRLGVSKDPSTWTQHTGPIGTFDGATDYSISFGSLDGQAPGFWSRIFGGGAPSGEVRRATTGGWLGFVDKYWLTALVPDARGPVQSAFRSAQGERYQAQLEAPAQAIAPGASAATSTRFFAGAKEVATLDRYEDGGIARFDRAIDWGWFVWFEKPIFYLLDWLFKAVGNFGVAIMLLTLIVRGLMFPVAQKQFASMAAMRSLQPKLKALQERHKDDKQKLQLEMMELYKREKVNPLAGCLPMVIQIPIFYALYKVLMLTIEMRHQPFVLWIRDLSAPDPATPINLFGLLAFTPPHFLALGVLPILLGITMYFQFKLNPTPMDPAQQQIFSIMPWVFMFIMAPFAAGLQLYWTTSNILTIAQQKYLYSRHPALKNAPAK